MISEARRKSYNRYIKAHYTIVACKVRREVAEEFKAACAANGTTPNAVLTKCVIEFIEKKGRP